MDHRQLHPLASSQPIAVFVLELVTTGYFGADIAESFRREGRAMFDAVRDDLERIAGVSIVTIDGNRTTLLRSVANVRAQYSLIIAPEFDGLLESFCEAARQSGTKSLNCGPTALKLGADKWEFTRHLADHELPTIPTRLLSLDEIPPEFPCVIKPRYGAGSWLLRLVRGAGEFARLAANYRDAGLTECLCQPEIVGRACSIAALVRPGFPSHVLPVAEQQLSTDGEYRYLGGRVPAELPAKSAADIQSLMQRLIASLPDLNGYIGCDVIVPEHGRPLIVELNPRVTTSYLGYRRLCEGNLMERLLFPTRTIAPLRWKSGCVTFDAAE